MHFKGRLFMLMSTKLTNTIVVVNQKAMITNTVRMAVGVVKTNTSVVLPPTNCFKVISSDFSDHDGAPNIAVGAREEFIAKNGRI